MKYVICNVVYLPHRFWENQISGEVSMFEVSEKATEMIKETFRDQEEMPSFRVIYNEDG